MVTSSRESISTAAPSGFRDFLNLEAKRRAKLIKIISDVYESFGFSPIDTPALENSNVLLSSGGGEENEKLIFKVLKRGDKLKAALESQNENEISDLGMRFDLTVPLSRVVANYRNEIHFPWKVYHIANVWRAERAQKGRFREFTQCDVDIVGSKSHAAELEVIQVVAHAVAKAGAENFELRINDRRLLSSLAEYFGFKGNLINPFSIALDKKDKAKPEEIRRELDELLGKKCSNEIDELISGNLSFEKIKKINPEVSGELKNLIDQLKALNLPLSAITFDPSLARGLSYYTGAVFELRHPSAGYSLGGGGRYDQLIGRFSKQEIPACGFSIGFDRLLLLLTETEKAKNSVLFIPIFSEDLRIPLCHLANGLRREGITVDVYPDEAKLKTQFKYAADLQYQWVLIVGEDEWKTKTFKLKDFSSGQETSVSEANLISHLKKFTFK
ncbi:MAG: Histidine--tRNA ligase [Bacteriovoracaceae bacterium]|nr:Histidine--tRNA ligase [Bacteriovoracaceae bacterium]